MARRPGRISSWIDRSTRSFGMSWAANRPPPSVDRARPKSSPEAAGRIGSAFHDAAGEVRVELRQGPRNHVNENVLVDRLRQDTEDARRKGLTQEPVVPVRREQDGRQPAPHLADDLDRLQAG